MARCSIQLSRRIARAEYFCAAGGDRLIIRKSRFQSQAVTHEQAFFSLVQHRTSNAAK